jgi:flagellar biosynthesis protein FliQ
MSKNDFRSCCLIIIVTLFVAFLVSIVLSIYYSKETDGFFDIAKRQLFFFTTITASLYVVILLFALITNGLLNFISWLFPSLKNYPRMEIFVGWAVVAVILLLFVKCGIYIINDKDGSGGGSSSDYDYECTGYGKYRDCY